MKKLIIFISLIFVLGLCHANAPTGLYGLTRKQLDDTSIYKTVRPVMVKYNNESQLKMICDAIQYLDKKEYSWYSPYVTEYIEYGNCIDVAIYYCFIANTQLGKDYEIAIFKGKYDNTKCHAVVDFKNGTYYDPIAGRIFNTSKWNFVYNVTLTQGLNIAYKHFGFR